MLFETPEKPPASEGARTPTRRQVVKPQTFTVEVDSDDEERVNIFENTSVEKTGRVASKGLAHVLAQLKPTRTKDGAPVKRRKKPSSKLSRHEKRRGRGRPPKHSTRSVYTQTDNAAEKAVNNVVEDFSLALPDLPVSIAGQHSFSELVERGAMPHVCQPVPSEPFSPGSLRDLPNWAIPPKEKKNAKNPKPVSPAAAATVTVTTSPPTFPTEKDKMFADSVISTILPAFVEKPSVPPFKPVIKPVGQVAKPPSLKRVYGFTFNAMGCEGRGDTLNRRITDMFSTIRRKHAHFVI
tara:strand:+ start:3923 stop:4807 length:885 start_codon:yes stop_codon:yes gene_type:complete